MAHLWSRARDVVCLHPGWPALSGRDAVLEAGSRSSATLARARSVFTAPTAHQIGADTVAVVCYEQAGDVIMVATNVFVVEDERPAPGVLTRRVTAPIHRPQGRVNMTIEIVNHTAGAVRSKTSAKDRYCRSDVHGREWDGVWRQTWLLAGLESDVRQPGEFFVFDLGREQFWSRAPTGDVQGFYNVCQHRGNRLVTSERGHAPTSAVPTTPGPTTSTVRLTIVPYAERFARGVPCAERSLRTVHTAGVVRFCVRQSGRAAPGVAGFPGSGGRACWHLTGSTQWCWSKTRPCTLEL